MAGALLGAGLGLVVTVLAALLALVVGALVLRLACKICGATVPSFLKAVGVVIVVGIASAIPYVIVVAVMGVVARAVGTGGSAIIMLIGVVIGLLLIALVSAALYMPLLSTSFGKGIAIFLVQLAIAIAIGLVITLVVFVVSLAVGGLSH